MSKQKIATAMGILAALFGCAGVKQSMVDPDTLFAESKPALAGVETSALAGKVKAYLRDQHSITEARFYAEPADSSWSEISLYVANEMGAVKSGTTGGPSALERPSWHDAFDMIDLYPAKGTRTAFAVALAEAPLADGSKLLGYFKLKSVVPKL